MRISEMIELLEKAKRKDGDLEVLIDIDGDGMWGEPTKVQAATEITVGGEGYEVGPNRVLIFWHDHEMAEAGTPETHICKWEGHADAVSEHGFCPVCQ